MTIRKEIIKIYAQALQNNDYETIVGLFSEDAKVFSFQAGILPPALFFRNLFSTTTREKVLIKNIMSDIDGRAIVSANILLENVILSGSTEMINIEVVDIFEFNSENKIQSLKIVLDTKPISDLRTRLQQQKTSVCFIDVQTQTDLHFFTLQQKETNETSSEQSFLKR